MGISFYLISCFHDQRSHFIAYASLYLISYKADVRNMLQKYSKQKILKIKLFIQNERIETNCSWKGLFTSIKEHLYLKKGHLDNPEE